MIIAVLKFLIISLCITLAIALGLILSDRPKALTPKAGLDFQQALSQDLSTAPATKTVLMRDGYALPLRQYGAQSATKPLIIMVHGSGWNGLQFHHIASKLEDKAHVLSIDLRGHGAAPTRRGDIDYTGQYEDDLADLIKATALPKQKVILLGHSSGGGLVVRFAGGKHGKLMDHAILLAPYLGHRAASSRPASGGWAHVLTRRIIGLSMLNMLRIRMLNHLTVIQFNFPESIINGPNAHLITKSYSYRLNTSYAPRWDFETDIAALPDFTLIAGENDEAFIAENYQSTMQNHTSYGQYHLLPDITHLSVVDAPETLQIIKDAL